MKTKTSTAKFANQEQLNVLGELLMDNVEELFCALKVDECIRHHKLYTMNCPIHAGDNKSAVNLYHTGKNYRGNWVCNTNHCHTVFQPTIIGFVRGCLSELLYNYSTTNKQATFSETVRWCEGFTKQDVSAIKIDSDGFEKKQFARRVEMLTERPTVHSSTIDRPLVKKHLAIPSTQFIKRGYSREVLERYDVGECLTHGREMYGRTVIPIYDDDHKFVIGCTGRSLNPECEECGHYHDPKDNCPNTDLGLWLAAKWRHSKGFAADENLFNYWFAKDEIKKHGVCVLVESPGNVLRLEDAGIKNSLGLFGSSLRDGQRLKLEFLGVMTILLLLDNDKAGNVGRAQIKEELKHAYEVTELHVPVSRNDVGELDTQLTKDLFFDKVEKICKARQM